MVTDSCNNLKDRHTDQWDSTEIPVNPHIYDQLNLAREPRTFSINDPRNRKSYIQKKKNEVGSLFHSMSLQQLIITV